MTTPVRSVDPLRKEIAALQLSLDLVWCQGQVLAEVLGVLCTHDRPSERLTSEMVTRRCLLIPGFAERERHSNDSRLAVEFDLQDVRDVIGCEASPLGLARLHEERQRLCDANRVGKLHQTAFVQLTLHHRFGHLSADVRCRPVHLGGILTSHRSHPTTVREQG